MTDWLNTISFLIVLALGAWIILSSMRKLSLVKCSAVLVPAASLLLLDLFCGIAWLASAIAASAMFLYSVGYFHLRVLNGSAKYHQASVKTLARSLILVYYSFALALVLGLACIARIRSSYGLYIVVYALEAVFTGLLIWRQLSGGVLENAADGCKLVSVEEKLLCAYSAEYMGWVCSSRNNDAIFSRVELYFKSEEMPFCKSDLLLADVARKVLTNKVYLSRAIHSKTGLNFCQYVNRFRVEYAKELYTKDPTLHVNELATMSGFATMTTFCNAFRAIEGMSPGDWTRVHIQNIKKRQQQ
ncbi:MAG: helix-turn-helix domain-containing protein [Bacteroidales bacterium]|nr:helix-turn-helix domain-containing protein [Bacteroidales bacterium]